MFTGHILTGVGVTLLPESYVLLVLAFMEQDQPDIETAEELLFSMGQSGVDSELNINDHEYRIFDRKRVIFLYCNDDYKSLCIETL